jgi:hypothetical protein
MSPILMASGVSDNLVWYQICIKLHVIHPAFVGFASPALKLPGHALQKVVRLNFAMTMTKKLQTLSLSI